MNVNCVRCAAYRCRARPRCAVALAHSRLASLFGISLYICEGVDDGFEGIKGLLGIDTIKDKPLTRPVAGEGHALHVLLIDNSLLVH